MVAEITRTSTRTVWAPPTRWNAWSTSTRRIFDWVPGGMSATSSKKRMPVWARSKRPGSTPRSALSRPNSTSSICSAPIEAELTVTNGPLARSELRCR